MPQTANKGLEQPTRGSEVGVWDTPVNNNTGIIDNSFGGVATVALTNVTVTLSSAQYQNVFLVFTGAISANVPVVLPAVGSFYTVQNLTSNTSAFYVTLATTVAASQSIGLPPGEAIDVFTDGSNVKFRNLGRIGSYVDFSGSSVPNWVGACSVPPYLNCDGTSFSSATYPILATILGQTTLPDSKGRQRLTLNQGSGRITTANSSIDGDTRFSVGGAGTLITLLSSNVPELTVDDNAMQLSNNLAVDPGTALSVAQWGGPAEITVGTTSPNPFNALEPSYVGGITMIRAA